MLDIRKGVGIVVDLDHIVLVDAVDGAVGAPADLLAAFHGDHPVGLVHLQDLGKAGHVQDLIYLGVHIDDAHIRKGFLHAQYHAQARAGNIRQLLCVQHDGPAGLSRKLT